VIFCYLKRVFGGIKISENDVSRNAKFLKKYINDKKMDNNKVVCKMTLSLSFPRRQRSFV
jgi:hypothetical protein